jgi:hypothetical protein
MKKLEDFTKDELFLLCVNLLEDSAEVQGMYVDEFAETYGVEL